MSFETWKETQPEFLPLSPFHAFCAGYAESEAQIAALQSEVAILKESNKGYQRTAQTILEIKSERDALREALREAIPNLQGDVLLRVRLLAPDVSKLSIPASGEPARKP